jgi:hypothetical protein
VIRLMLRVLILVKYLYCKPSLIAPMEKILSNKKVGFYQGITETMLKSQVRQGLPQNQAKTWAPPHKTPPNSQLSQDYKTISILVA